MSLAHRNLFQNKTRLSLNVGGVALAVMLILVLNGFLDGMYRQITSYLDYSPGTLVVAQEDVVNLLGATSHGCGTGKGDHHGVARPAILFLRQRLPGRVCQPT